VWWNGVKYSLTAGQSEVVEILWDAAKNNTPEVSQDYIVAKLELPEKTRIAARFYAYSTWGTFVMQGKTRGTLQLNLEERK
jgi:hypothetical protein